MTPIELLTKKGILLKGEVINWERYRSTLVKKELHFIEEEIVLINENVGEGIFLESELFALISLEQ